MKSRSVQLERIDGAIWLIIAATAILVVAVAADSDFRLVWSSHLGLGAVLGLLALGHRVYSRWRPEPRLAASLGATAQILAFAAVAAPLSYMGASLALPLHDRLFDTVDRTLGLDWHALLGWMNSLEDLHAALRWIYLSLMPQTVVVVLALAFSGHFAWLRVFVLSCMLATLLTIGIAALLPAQGPWGFFEIGPSDHGMITPATRETHLAIFHGLRDGSFRLLKGHGYEGIITFPSLHAALAVLLAAGLWPVRVLRWSAIVLNGIMLVSIPIDGGHYFIDVLAGLSVAWASLRFAQWAVEPEQRQRVPDFVFGTSRSGYTRAAVVQPSVPEPRFYAVVFRPDRWRPKTASGRSNRASGA